MLSVHKPIMDAAFAKLTVPGNALTPDIGGAIYKAAYHAYYDVGEKRINDCDAIEDPDLAADAIARKQEALMDLKNDSHMFATAFNDAMKECLKEISNQIDDHIKSMMLTINIPAVLPTLVSPVGPVTGALTIS